LNCSGSWFFKLAVRFSRCKSHLTFEIFSLALFGVSRTYSSTTPSTCQHLFCCFFKKLCPKNPNLYIYFINSLFLFAALSGSLKNSPFLIIKNLKIIKQKIEQKMPEPGKKTQMRQ